MSAQSEDAELVTATRRGDDRAFEELYARYQRRIAAYVFGMVKDHARAEDITQDVFMAALRRMRDTDREIAFKPWVYEIAKNACIDQFRRARRAEEVSMDVDEGLGGVDGAQLSCADHEPHAAVAQKQQMDHLRGAFGGLSESHHQILVMREFEGLSYRQIGEKMGMSRPSVESTLFRARKRLTEEYDDLVSGERCRRVHAIIDAAAASAPGARDTRRMARHVSYCQLCRRHATLAGLGDLVPDRTGARAKVAAVLPLPVFLRDRWLGIEGHGDAGWQAWAANFTPALEPAAAGWAKAVATAATVAIVGLGAGAATQNGGLDLAPALGAQGVVVAASDAGSTASSGGTRADKAANERTDRAESSPSRGTSGGSTSAAAPAAGTTENRSGSGDSDASSGAGGQSTGSSGTGGGFAAGTATPAVDLPVAITGTLATPAVDAADPAVGDAVTGVGETLENAGGATKGATDGLSALGG